MGKGHFLFQKTLHRKSQQATSCRSHAGQVGDGPHSMLKTCRCRLRRAIVKITNPTGTDTTYHTVPRAVHTPSLPTTSP